MEKMPAGIKGAWVENKRAVGSRYEAEAAVFLEKLGYKILEQNYRDRLGEIDIVAREGAYLVFVEVNTAKTAGAGTRRRRWQGESSRESAIRPGTTCTAISMGRIRPAGLMWSALTGIGSAWSGMHFEMKAFKEISGKREGAAWIMKKNRKTERQG